jgi:hypothetical protein
MLPSESLISESSAHNSSNQDEEAERRQLIRKNNDSVDFHIIHEEESKNEIDFTNSENNFNIKN